MCENRVKESVEKRDEYRERTIKEKPRVAGAMLLDGQFVGDTKAIEIKYSWNCLTKGELKH